MDEDIKPQVCVESESEERTRTFSEKGQVYDYKQLSELYEKLKKHSVYLLKLIEGNASFEVIKSSYSTWMSDFELYLEKHNWYNKRTRIS